MLASMAYLSRLRVSKKILAWLKTSEPQQYGDMISRHHPPRLQEVIDFVKMNKLGKVNCIIVPKLGR